jgi:hypothetical protein
LIGVPMALLTPDNILQPQKTANFDAGQANQVTADSESWSTSYIFPAGNVFFLWRNSATFEWEPR